MKITGVDIKSPPISTSPKHSPEKESEKTGNKDKILRAPLPGTIMDIKAVSYTHLRAHETVLDLVCRLLLEKKKKKKIDTRK